MKQCRIPICWLIISSIIAGVLFYLILIVFSKYFPSYTGRVFSNEWILVVISAIPLLIVLAFFIISYISKAKIASIELDFDKQILGTLIENLSLDERISRDFLTKGEMKDLDCLVKDISDHNKRPIYLKINIKDRSMIKFSSMCQYIYKLSRVAPIKFIVFLGENDHLLGFTTIDMFKAKFPSLDNELLIDGIKKEYNLYINSNYQNSITETKYIKRYKELIGKELNSHNNLDNDDVRILPSHLNKLGVLFQKVHKSESVSHVYWLLTHENLEGVPVVDYDDKFIGIVKKEQINQVIIEKLIQ